LILAIWRQFAYFSIREQRLRSGIEPDLRRLNAVTRQARHYPQDLWRMTR